MNKINTLAHIAALGMLSATSLTAQSIDPYRVLVLQGGDSQIKDGWIQHGNVLYGANSTNKIDSVSLSNASLYGHTTATLDGGTMASGYDTQINQAIFDAQNFCNSYGDFGPNGTADVTAGVLQDVDYSYSSTQSLTLIDFTSIDLDNNTFSLTGRVGEDDHFIIRTDSITFSESYVNLTNIDADNVSWLVTDGGSADIMHGSPIDDGNLYGFSGSVYNKDGQIRVGAEGPFEGAVIGGNILLGSGFALVPEPSSAFLLAVSGLILGIRRRRK